MSREQDEQDRRIEAIVGDEEDPTRASKLWLDHLRAALRLPCDVVGVEDFRWEEPYVLGVGDRAEYRRLCIGRPSYRDVFSLERLEPDAMDSKWAMSSDDIGAWVRRRKDGREFLLGLSELKPADKDSPNRQLMYDFAVWFVNYR